MFKRPTRISKLAAWIAALASSVRKPKPSSPAHTLSFAQSKPRASSIPLPPAASTRRSRVAFRRLGTYTVHVASLRFVKSTESSNATRAKCLCRLSSERSPSYKTRVLVHQSTPTLAHQRVAGSRRRPPRLRGACRTPAFRSRLEYSAGSRNDWDFVQSSNV